MSAEIGYETMIDNVLDDSLKITNKSNIKIQGGIFTADKLKDFLNDCVLTDMDYRIWETYNNIAFEKNQAKQILDFDMLERARFFGDGGDLAIRRDGDTFYWHFIGDHTPLKSSSQFDAVDFWKESPEVKADSNFFLHRQQDQHAILWSEEFKRQSQQKGVWFDNRVGWADLSYPVQVQKKNLPKPKAYIKYDIYSHAGQIAFVWWKEVFDA